jgi:D-3-phosphoglycerate dehydrogenase/glyoxylate/hydroxypyruvate reductase A
LTISLTALGVIVSLPPKNESLGERFNSSKESQEDEQDKAGFLAGTDILVCALPLTDDTRGLLDRHTLSLLPRGAIVINVGRGEHLMEADLHALLDEGHLAGAALDVFEREPLPHDSWVWTHPKVLATPHIASQASAAITAQQCVDALRRAREGLHQPLAVNRQGGY